MKGAEMLEDECNEKGISEMDTLEWKKMCRVISGKPGFLKLSGFREGALAGRDAAFQNGFNSGYAEGFHNGLLLGHIKGISRIAGKEEELNCELAHSELSKTSRGCCQLCATNDNPVSSEIQNQSLSDIIQKQQDFIHSTLKSIQNKNADFVREYNISLPLNCTNQGRE